MWIIMSTPHGDYIFEGGICSVVIQCMGRPTIVGQNCLTYQVDLFSACMCSSTDQSN